MIVAAKRCHLGRLHLEAVILIEVGVADLVGAGGLSRLPVRMLQVLFSRLALIVLRLHVV